MAKFSDVKTLQKLSTVHASIYNHFNLEFHLKRRNIFKKHRAVALAEWCQIAA
jgi:putative transposase